MSTTTTYSSSSYSGSSSASSSSRSTPPTTTRSRRATELRSQIWSVYHSHCVEEVYPRCQCNFYKLHNCSYHLPDLSGKPEKPKPSEIPGHILKVEGPGICDNCKATQLANRMLRRFFDGTLDFQVRNANPQAPPNECTLTGWRCTQCEQTSRFELKLCKAHDEKDATFSKRLRSGACHPAFVAGLRDHLQAEIGKQPTCVNCTGRKHLCDLIDEVARTHRVDIGYGYLPAETRVSWSRKLAQ